jgi:hypothetical protein
MLGVYPLGMPLQHQVLDQHLKEIVVEVQGSHEAVYARDVVDPSSLTMSLVCIKA